MTAAQFKQCAKNYAIKVHSARSTKEGVIVSYSRYLDENGWPFKCYNSRCLKLSQVITREFHGKSYAEIIDARFEN